MVGSAFFSLDFGLISFWDRAAEEEGASFPVHFFFATSMSEH